MPCPPGPWCNAIDPSRTPLSAIAFAGIVHLGATVPERFLRCILDCRDMVTLVTADFDAPVRDGGVLAPRAPGLGITVRRDVLGAPVAQWTA